MSSDLNKVWRLLQTSEDFLLKAKASKGLDIESTYQYNTYVKCSLNCLLKIVKLYGTSLNAQIEATLYLKIATILFEETASFDMAREYCNKGIQICKRNEPQLIINKIQIQYLNFQIHFKLDTDIKKREAMAYIHQVIEEIPNLDTYLILKIFFKFTKLKYFEAHNTCHQAIFILTNLIKDSKLCLNLANSVFYEFLLINKLQLQITSNQPRAAILESLQELDDVQQKHRSNLPPQFKAITLLAKAMLVLEVNDYSQTKEHMKALNSFIKSSNTVIWKDENIAVKLLDGFSIQFQWFSYEEFLIVSYILLGVSNMIKPWDGNATSSIFERAHKLLDQKFEKLSEEGSSSLIELYGKEVKLRYFKYLVDIYSILSLLISGEYPTNLENDVFESKKSLKELLINFENETLTPLERMAYQGLIPLLLYLKAIIYQRNGYLNNAFDVYSELILHYSAKTLLRSKEYRRGTQKLQSFGIPSNSSQPLGVRNQLYSISVINIFPLLEAKIQHLKLQQEALDEFDLNYKNVMLVFESHLELKSKLKQELNLLRDVVSQEANGFRQDWLTYLTVLIYDYLTGDDPEKESETLALFNGILSKFSEHKPRSISSDTKAGIINGLELKIPNLILDLAPLLRSILHYIVGMSQRSDNFYSAKSNINFKIEHLTKVMKYSKKSQPKRSSGLKNGIGKLAALKIRDILEINSNFFDTEAIEYIENDIKSFN